MRPAAQPLRRLVADIGGTNTRIALYDEQRGGYEHRNCYRNRDFPLSTAFAAALAGDADQVVMTNMPWSFSQREVADTTGAWPMCAG